MSEFNTSENFQNPLSYSTIRNLLTQFKKSSGKSGSEFNKFETPGQFYFKILFYFNNINDSNAFTSNLLGCDWLTDELSDYETYGTSKDSQRKIRNSAYNYLKINDENERAEKLKKFIYLLSDINSQSPWYWSSISGLDTAIERKSITDKDFKIEEERKQLSIKCLPDAYDQRIGTLLDLYRDICYSYTLKKEILPANLRKFDMGIYIFNTPIKELHGKAYDSELAPVETEARISSQHNDYNLTYKTSSKYFEFHNCEIDYNSSKSAYGELSNVEGNQLEYTINISYDDCYENRFNEFLMRDMGDFIQTDLIELSNINIESISQEYDKTIGHETQLKNRLNNSPTFAGRILGHIQSKIETPLKSLYLGNLYTLSLSNLKDQAKDLLSGNIFGTYDAVMDYVEHINGKKPSDETLIGKKLWESVENQTETPSGNMYEYKMTPQNSMLSFTRTRFEGYDSVDLFRKQQQSQLKSLRNNI